MTPLKEKHPDVEWDFTILKSGPLGGDQQMGSRIVDGEIDYLFFFTDPMTLQPHDTDVKALTRLASVENIVFCCNRSTYVLRKKAMSSTATPCLRNGSGTPTSMINGHITPATGVWCVFTPIPFRIITRACGMCPTYCCRKPRRTTSPQP